MPDCYISYCNIKYIFCDFALPPLCVLTWFFLVPELWEIQECSQVAAEESETDMDVDMLRITMFILGVGLIFGFGIGTDVSLRAEQWGPLKVR